MNWLINFFFCFVSIFIFLSFLFFSSSPSVSPSNRLQFSKFLMSSLSDNWKILQFSSSSSSSFSVVRYKLFPHFCRNLSVTKRNEIEIRKFFVFSFLFFFLHPFPDFSFLQSSFSSLLSFFISKRESLRLSWR